jgi:hypothetical protein
VHHRDQDSVRRHRLTHVLGVDTHEPINRQVSGRRSPLSRDCLLRFHHF